MMLGNMRYNGVRGVAARCEACGPEAVALAETIAVPELSL
jgi:hypothetical protein